MDFWYQTVSGEDNMNNEFIGGTASGTAVLTGIVQSTLTVSLKLLGKGILRSVGTWILLS